VENKFIKILIVEDELISRKALNSFLLPLGDLDIAVNGNEALTVVEKAIENNQLSESILYPKSIAKYLSIQIVLDVARY
jgi:CheY-like chemotaxis protein